MTRGTKKDTDPQTGKPLPKGVTYRDGAYQARAMVKGQRFTETFPSGALARRWLNELKGAVSLGQFRDTRHEQKTTIRSILEAYRDAKMQTRENDRKGHLPYVMDDPISSLTVADWKAKDVRAFRERMKADGYADGTIVKRMNLLASAIQYAISELDIHTENFASGRVVKRPEGADKKRNRRLKPASRDNELDEYEHLKAIVSAKSDKFPDDIWLVRWSVESACRLSESIGLAWSDVDLENRTIRFLKTKNEKHRIERGYEYRPISPMALSVLLDKLNGQAKPTSGKVFNVGTSDAFSVRFGRYTTEAQLEDLTFHDLRHEATSRIAIVVKSPLDLMRFTGHKDIKSLNRYYQPDPHLLAKLFDE